MLTKARNLDKISNDFGLLRKEIIMSIAIAMGIVLTVVGLGLLVLAAFRAVLNAIDRLDGFGEFKRRFRPGFWGFVLSAISGIYWIALLFLK